MTPPSREPFSPCRALPRAHGRAGRPVRRHVTIRSQITDRRIGARDLLARVVPALVLLLVSVTAGVAAPANGWAEVGRPGDAAAALVLPGPSAEEGSDVAALRHTYLEESHPGADEVTEEEVVRIVLRYNTPVQMPFSRVTVRDATGREVAHRGVERAPDEDDHHIQVAFDSPLAPGSYTVEWQTAGPDDHVIRDTFNFSVEGDEPEEDPELEPRDPAEPAPVDTPPAAPVAEWTDPAERPIGAVIRWLFLLGLVGMIGTTGFRLLVLPPLGRTEGMAPFAGLAAGRTRVLAWASAILAMGVLPVLLWLQSASFFQEEALRPGNLGAVVFQTAWGSGFMLSVAAVVLFAAGLVLAAREDARKLGWTVATFAALLLPLAMALSGHAWAAEAPRLLSVGSLYLHVLAASVWLGGLGVLLLAALPALRTAKRNRARERDEEPKDRLLPGLGTVVSAFSRVALVAVALLVLSGVVQAWIQVETLTGLFGSGYGRTLLLKVGIALGAFGLGFYNWRVVRPGLRDRPEPGTLRIPATVELLLGIVVLLVTAVLVVQPLP